jgi:membrane fusion protein (multidrug efflux system)
MSRIRGLMLLRVAKARGDMTQYEVNPEYAKNQVSLLQAQADLAKARQDVDRPEPLARQERHRSTTCDNARVAFEANETNVAARRANVQQNCLSTTAQIDTAGAQGDSVKALPRNAELNPEYATIHAPLSGRIGDSLIPVGGLVSKTAPTPLTTIFPLDPVWVRFKVSESQYPTSQKRPD